MADLEDGEVFEMQGSAAKPYELKNTGGVYSCSCPAWRNQSVPIQRRTCKHLRRLRGDAAEEARIVAAGGVTSAPRKAAGSKKSGAADGAEGAPVLLAERWDGLQDPAGWWMSEKLDGVRAYWNGKEFLSRLGNPYLAPDWFKAGLPETPLDGELWAGRKQFQRAVSIVRRQDKGERWREITFVIFDAPALDAPFEERLGHCRELLGARETPHARVHEHAVCDGAAALRAELARVEALGGEGLMLRQPRSRYVAGRSSTLLKVKSFFDAEATVVEHLPGEGRHEGRLGALLVERPDGIRFSVGTGFSDAERESPPPIGSLVTYRYQELSTGGVPRFPSYVGVRDDVRAPAAITKGVRKAEVKSPEDSSAPPSPAAPSPPVPASPPPAPAAGSRRFEFADGKSSKFWEVGVQGCDMTVRFGRIGTAGQTKTKSFASEAAAAQEAAKLIAEKAGKGYQETSQGAD
jgi:DNA ligase-1